MISKGSATLRIAFGLLCLWAILCTLPRSAFAAAPVEVVAVTGDALPGSRGATIDDLVGTVSLAVIDGAGSVFFEADLSGAGVDTGNDSAALLWRDGALSVVIREGDPAPGIPGGLVRWAGASEAVLNEAGDLAISARLSGAAVTIANDQAVYVDRGAGLELLLREGGAVPGFAPGTVFESLFELRLDDAGHVALGVSISGVGSGVVREGPGGLEVIAAEGQSPPGVEPGVSYGLISRIAVNGAGQVAFTAFLADVGSGFGNEGLFSETFGPLDILVRVGSDVPGVPGEEFGAFGVDVLRVDAAGRVGFQDDFGPWVQRATGFEGPGRFGDPVPGLEPGTTFAGVLNAAPELAAESGAAAALAAIEGGTTTTETDRVIWRDLGSGLEVLVRSGDIALIEVSLPIVVFTFFESFDPELLDDGTLLMTADLKGTNISALDDTSLWAIRRDGKPVLMLREGDPIEVAPGDERKLSNLPALVGFVDPPFSEFGVSTGGPRSFNDRGEIAIATPLQDGSEALLVVPEPDGAALGLVAGLALASTALARSARPASRRSPQSPQRSR